MLRAPECEATQPRLEILQRVRSRDDSLTLIGSVANFKFQFSLQNVLDEWRKRTLSKAPKSAFFKLCNSATFGTFLTFNPIFYHDRAPYS